ncbi:hypothetical protein [Bradyrhizobium jicamae]|uniref:hypothetical protein n=1 Tax=Bradyrhizobium jicamae TaxID=280332 RepID=UPI0012EDDB7E|nr:hypothetical protein [Bradyrhizobium jicamae]
MTNITDEPAYLIELAEVLEASEETTLGPTDAHLAAVALLHYAAFLDANTPMSAL